MEAEPDYGFPKEKLQEFNETLSKQPFFGNLYPSSIDRSIFSKLTTVPPANFPNLLGWYNLIKKFSISIIESWTDAKVEDEDKKEKKDKKDKKNKKDKKDKKDKAEKEKVEEIKVQKVEVKAEIAKEAPKNEDDIGLFDDGPEDVEAKAALEKKKKEIEDQKKAETKKKKKESGKTLFVFNVKVYDVETNLDDLAIEIKKITVDGLKWIEKYEIEPVAYDIKMLTMQCIVEDEKVESTDDIIDMITALYDGETVQSVDIASIQKL